MTTQKSRTVTIEGKEYTRTVSEIFATDKDFKNSIDITDKNSYEFKEGLKKIGAEDTKYILGQNIIDSDTKENLKLNRQIIQAIVSEGYNGKWFEFIKSSGLVKLDGNKISKSELTSYRSSDGDWRSGYLGDYGYIWLRAVNESGDPRYVRFREDWASFSGDYPKSAMRVASLNKQMTEFITGPKMPTKEIIPLYRIYNIKNKRYVSLSEYFVDGNGIIYQNEYLNLSCCGDWSSLLHKADNQNNYIIERCSGLKDTNGVYIYEGDKLEIVSKYYVGIKDVYYNGSFSIKTYPTSYSETLKAISLYDTDEFKVIGTIHD